MTRISDASYSNCFDNEFQLIVISTNLTSITPNGAAITGSRRTSSFQDHQNLQYKVPF